jgi:DNA-binding MarR family transcriptional regulator
MTNPDREQLERQVVLGAREYGISTVLFRHAIGDRLGINVTDMECLGVLFFKQIATPGELSKYTGLSSGATTAMLNRLEAAQLITRRPNPKDGRGTLIVVSREATQTIGPLFAGVRNAQDEMLTGYSDGELELISSFFKRYTEIWEQERSKLDDAR